MGKKRAWATWLWSDPHFGHDNVLDFCNRPFKDMDEMVEKMRENYNAKVKPEDQCIWVGDCFFYWNKAKVKEFMDSLNGTKILVRGNHDRKPRDMKAMGFDFVCERMSLHIANERVDLCHYPFRTPRWKHEFYNIRHKICKFLNIKGTWAVDLRFYKRRPKDEGQFLIHGHTHSSEKVRGRMIHVGVDAWNYSPVSMGEIGNLISEIKRNEDLQNKT